MARKRYLNFKKLVEQFTFYEVTLTRVETVVDHVQYAKSYKIIALDTEHKKITVKAYGQAEKTWSIRDVNKCQISLVHRDYSEAAMLSRKFGIPDYPVFTSLQDAELFCD